MQSSDACKGEWISHPLKHRIQLKTRQQTHHTPCTRHTTPPSPSTPLPTDTHPPHTHAAHTTTTDTNTHTHTPHTLHRSSSPQRAGNKNRAVRRCGSVSARIRTDDAKSVHFKREISAQWLHGDYHRQSTLKTIRKFDVHRRSGQTNVGHLRSAPSKSADFAHVRRCTRCFSEKHQKTSGTT